MVYDTDTHDTDTYLAATEREGAAVAAVAAACDLDTPVPSCPRWDLQRLVGHLGRVYNWVSAHVEARASTMLDRDGFPQAPQGAAVVDWYAEAHDRALAALAGIGGDEEVWSWSGINTGAFWHRRMAHESLIHRWDAESAAGTPGALDSDLAADGVDELVGVVLPFQVRASDGPLPEGTMHLHRTDGDGEWLCRIAGGRMEAERVHARGDVAVRGTGEQLDLVLWRRIQPDDVEVFGDVGVLDSWTALGR